MYDAMTNGHVILSPDSVTLGDDPMSVIVLDTLVVLNIMALPMEVLDMATPWRMTGM